MTSGRAGDGRICEPGRNCWRIERAERAALLVDGDAYFTALRRAACRAQRAIFIIGWDVDSRTPLPPGGDGDGLPETLGPFLDALVERSPHLHVYVLDWDFALLYALDREILPIYNFGWRTHERLHFHLDDRHPTGASHHQKIVVVDDSLAFVGGLDLTKGRWDTPRHAPEEPRRRSPDDEPYAPFHDAQLMVLGDVAAALGDLARERWRRATGRKPGAAVAERAGDLWPTGVEPDFEQVDIAIARTQPAFGAEEPLREVHALYLDAIRAATRYIYLENQYFTSGSIGRAIGERLQEPDGPEVVIVTRLRGGGWLEQNTMEVLRARLLEQLAPLDQHGRLRVYYPALAGLGESCIDLHSKIMIVDDRLLRIGSSNLNNRSMGIDTECDLLVEAHTPRQAGAIAAMRNRLLAEHLGIETQEFADAFEKRHSLVGAIEAMQGKDRTLKVLEPDIDPALDRLVPAAETIDPEDPVDVERLVGHMVPAPSRPRARRHILGVTLLLLAVAALAVAWRWGPLREWLDMDLLRSLVDAIERSPWTPVWMLGIYVAASLTAMPITVLIVATAFVFGPWTTFLYAMTGSLLGGGITFAAGQVLGRRAVRRIAGRRLEALSRRLGEGGIVAVMVLRMLPVAPFTVVNVVAGASHLRARDFLIGTALGMTPGVLAVTLFSDRLLAALRDPSPASVLLLALALAAVGLGALGIRALLRGHSRARQSR